MSVIIRYASRHDIPAVAAMWEQMVQELAPDYTPNRVWWEEMATALIQTSAYQMLVAVEDMTGQVVGFLDGFLYPEPSTGKLHGVGQHFYVVPEVRGSSVATRLYREAMRSAKSKGVEILELFCFRAERRFWEKKGFVPIRTMMRRPIYV